MTKNIAWVVTGAGAFLRDVVKAMYDFKRRYSVRISTFMTKWGYEVSRVFGVIPVIRKISPGGYYEEFVIGDMAMFYLGRFNMRRYSVLVIAPATSNTIAKIVHGIADNFPSAAYAQAIKSNVPVVILPSDIPGSDGMLETETPCHVVPELCTCIGVHGECVARRVCPVNAIEIVGSKARIDLSKCVGCTLCVSACTGKAIRCWDRIRLRPRDLDLKNIEKLRGFELTYVVGNVEELICRVRRILGL